MSHIKLVAVIYGNESPENPFLFSYLFLWVNWIYIVSQLRDAVLRKK